MTTTSIRRECARCFAVIFVPMEKNPSEHCLRCLYEVTQEKRKPMNTETIIDETETQLAPEEREETEETETRSEPSIAAAEKAHVNGSSGGGKPRRPRKPAAPKAVTAEPDRDDDDDEESGVKAQTLVTQSAQTRDEIAIEGAVSKAYAARGELVGLKLRLKRDLDKVEAALEMLGVPAEEDLASEESLAARELNSPAEKPKAPRAKRAARKVAAKATKPTKSGEPRAARGSRKDAAEAALPTILKCLKGAKEAIRSEAIQEKTKLGKDVVAMALKMGVESKAIKRKGHLRATEYSLKD